MTVNFTKNQEEITSAWRDVAESKETQKWALFGYEGNNNIITLMAKGSQGLEELVQEFNCSLIQYAFCRVIDNSIGLNKIVLINWQGDSAPLSRKGLCASHLGDVTNYFKGSSQTIIIRNDDEATSEHLMDQIKKNLSSRLSFSKQPTQEANDRDQDMGKVGAAYSRPDVTSEIPSDRKSFWQRQEEEEKQRLAEEKKRAAEKQAQFEKERKLVAESEAKKLAETIMERERKIDATRIAEKSSSSSLNNKASSKSNPPPPPSGTEKQDNNKQDKDDDERVGRRSELIRLERNQETLSLIGKGSIKNKRAIFEQASQQQQPPIEKRSSGNFSRRPSGQIITQRLSSLNLHNEAQNRDQSVSAKLTNGSSTHEESNSKSTIVKKQVETVKVTNDEEIVSKQDSSPVPAAHAPIIKHEVSNGGPAIAEKVDKAQNNHDGDSTVGATNDECKANNSINNNNTSPEPIKSESPVVKEIVIQGQAKLQARALYDYQAGDNTEISFDPDDIIGYIEKVDPGWWHGSVITGKYKGQCGLFPANYVQELK